MKLLFFCAFMVGICLHTNAQQIPNYSSIENGTNEQIRARANEAALQAATYILAVPPDTTNKNIKEAASYLVMWMAATSDYSFELDMAGIKLYDGNTTLLSVLFAAMVEYAINNPTEKNDKDKIRLNATRKLIVFAENPLNEIKMPNALKKAGIADKNGTLDKYLISLDKK